MAVASSSISSQEPCDIESRWTALSRAQALIEFELDGTIVDANENFLHVMGYTRKEIVGEAHSMFLDPADVRTAEYQKLWKNLRAGKLESGVFRLRSKGGDDVWLRASYTPILDASGKPQRVITFAADVSADRERTSNDAGQIEAIHRSQAVIEFDIEGQILDANENFLSLMGYELAEVRGRHHRMFVDFETTSATQYDTFWRELKAGNFQADEFKRIGKGAKEVWIQASYNPIFDLRGKVYKVVKFATDITAAKVANADYQGQIAAIGRAQAVISFDMQGKILDANENFLSTMGYSLREVVGNHHSMFVDGSVRSSPEYRAFWEQLNRGEFFADQFRRVGKGGREVWIQASYNPIFDLNGKPFKVVKYATDITEEKRQEALYRKEVAEVYRACTEGDLSYRGNTEELDETYTKILQSTNEIIDAITLPIQRVREQLSLVSKGDLTAYVNDDFAGDHAALKDALNATLDALNETLGNVSGIAQSVANGSREVSDASATLSQGATEQAASLQEITSTMASFAEQTKLSAANATEAATLADQARSTANRGDEMMKRLVDAMGELNGSSQRIRKVIKVIDDIAFQTNLLALNAAVEAARAGAHGRGFAVVAEEVRSLAGRSAKAAAETTEMIEDSLKKVHQGTGVADETAQALSEIVVGAGKVNDLVREIATASQHQAHGIGEIDEGLRQIDKVTQANTASAEQGAAAAQELSRQARELQRGLDRFSLRAPSEVAEDVLSRLPPELVARLREILAGRGAGDFDLTG